MVENDPSGRVRKEERDNEDRAYDKVFKEWESCGWLKEYIRCSTIPQDGDNAHFPPGILKVYEHLNNNCFLLVKKKFKRGQPCGDVVSAIINGTDGSRIKRPRVMHKLHELANYADILQSKAQPSNICRNCNKFGNSEEFQKSLMKCSRCKTVFYCSKVRYCIANN